MTMPKATWEAKCGMSCGRRRAAGIAGLCLALLFASAVPRAEAQAPFRYPAGTGALGQIQYHDNIPVIVVEGNSTERGKQIANVLKPAQRLLNYPKDCFKKLRIEFAWGSILEVAKSMVKNFPPEYRQELEAIAREAGVDLEILIVANTMFDIKKFFQCSTLYVGPERTGGRGPLLGRNLDFPTLGYLQDYTMLTIYKTPGKLSFASVGFPGMVGCLSGMNEAGLCLAVLEVYDTREAQVEKFDVQGIPYAMCFRKLLEECRTVAEAQSLLTALRRTTMINLAVCDLQSGGVFEITPRSVRFRSAQEGLCAATNHFRTPDLALDLECWRYELLTAASKLPQVGVSELARKLHEVNQGPLTLQTMIFEPTTSKLHLAIGPCPTTRLPLRTVELRPLFRSEPATPAIVRQPANAAQ